MRHDLKVWPSYFQAIIEGNKTFEIRDNSDRGFNAGDEIRLEEWCPKNMDYTGKFIDAKITYVTNFGQPENQVVFSFEVV